MADGNVDEVRTPPAPEPKKSGPLGLILALVVVTVVGGGGGAVLSTIQVNRFERAAQERANAEPARVESALAWDEESAVARLQPVVTNLAEPQGAWIRLDTAVVFDRDAVSDVERMKAELAESVVAFLRTVSLTDLEGASAFNYLRDDLNERARMVSAGTVNELIIETMVLQ